MKICILGISGGIGFALATRFQAQGHEVSGTLRDARKWIAGDQVILPHLVNCDFADRASIADAAMALPQWDVLIVASGTMVPVRDFWSANSDEWEMTTQINAMGPLRLLRMIYPKRLPDAAVCFLAGPNPLSHAPKFSAYHASKALLHDAMKGLDAETKDVRFFMIAPGIVNTKIHRQSDDHRGVYDGKLECTPPQDIFDCLNWCLSKSKKTIGGQIVHVVHDHWRDI